MVSAILLTLSLRKRSDIKFGYVIRLALCESSGPSVLPDDDTLFNVNRKPIGVESCYLLFCDWLAVTSSPAFPMNPREENE